MPIAYGQCKGRKYNNIQPLPEEKKPKKKPHVIKKRTCAKCGRHLPIEDFHNKHFCNDCDAQIRLRHS